MEVIRIPGYTEDEKLNIASRYLVPKQITDNGLKKGELEIVDETILDIIRFYTREAGVRNLEREIAKICRKVVKEITLKPAEGTITVQPDRLQKYLGVRRFRYGLAEEQDQIGQVTGLAWTEVGGELLSIEAALVPGKGKLIHTGQLGEVMQESIHSDDRGAQPRRVAGHRSRISSEIRRTHSRPGRGDAQGWPQRRHRHVYGAGLGAHPDSGAGQCRHDRRDHATRRGVADRRT
jgi:hypothetical protein